MNFFGKGKKGAKKREPMPQQQQAPAIDFSSPDAFSEENMAKVCLCPLLMLVCCKSEKAQQYAHG